MTAVVPELSAGSETGSKATRDSRRGLGRWVIQPLACVIAVVGSLVYVKVADVSDSERRSLGVSRLPRR